MMNGIKADPDIKMDPDAGTPSGSGYMDDDFYEDTGELQLPSRGVDKDVWLTRIPKWLFEKVSKWDDLADNGNDDEQVVIGEIMLLPDPQRPGAASKTAPMRVFLSDKWQEKAKVPRAFELTGTNASADQMGNTYIFTEKDLPGYRPNGYGQGKMSASVGFGIQDPKARIQKRGKYRKAIPKHTALLGSSTREYIANPIHTPEFNAFARVRARHAIQGANTKTNIIDAVGDHTSNQHVQKMFKTFIKPATAPKPQINKAARIPKNELIDLLHSCFDRFAYWPMKALKKETRQPEAYLKEVLTDIADLVKTGTFASCWRRQDMYNKNTAQQVLDKPPEMDDDVGGDDGDEEMEMEDVV
ncbi:uncharacterized protein BDR25DRAFT_265732 [Lindgomyces ingoldianus]|uniref:Uncharacterized protein n=1 Tax=Lindgomyces ingoldianus TaxID=673940 RepID=A0ACB6QM76_9PLEO|nr:uncharacterized protein BDR25DRAFT_265732 [Lindgomyces ingoldianus]KAF2468124.1 hypothetical protein BDR25DRAFT_265732 [Lindgomyces ingoldianus]